MMRASEYRGNHSTAVGGTGGARASNDLIIRCGTVMPKGGPEVPIKEGFPCGPRPR